MAGQAVVVYCEICGTGINLVKGDPVFKCKKCGTSPICAKCIDNETRACPFCAQESVKDSFFKLYPSAKKNITTEEMIKNLNNSGKITFDVGRHLNDSKRYADALQYFEMANKLNPKNSIVLSNLGVVFTQMGQFDKALDYFNKALSIDSSCAWIWNQKGVVFFLQRKNTEAMTCFDQAGALDRYFEMPWNYKKFIYMNSGKLEMYGECQKIATEISSSGKCTDNKYRNEGFI